MRNLERNAMSVGLVMLIHAEGESFNTHILPEV